MDMGKSVEKASWRAGAAETYLRKFKDGRQALVCSREPCNPGGNKQDLGARVRKAKIWWIRGVQRAGDGGCDRAARSGGGRDCGIAG